MAVPPFGHSFILLCVLIFLLQGVKPSPEGCIFEEIHVNIGLYFLVFGESLLNNGVTVGLYNTMKVLIDIPDIGSSEIFMALLSFGFVSWVGPSLDLS